MLTSLSLISGLRAAALLIAASIGGLWLAQADYAATVPLTAALAAVVGIAYQQSRARAHRRWLAVLDACAEREIIREQRRKELTRLSRI